jgi:DNA repair protein RecO (recombination protein O)
MADPHKLSGLVTVIGLTQLLAEREPHPRLYDALRIMLDTLDNDRMWPAVLVRYELGLLDELGFGLDLARCAVTGSSDDLVYVSPRTGRAVSGEAGAAYRERLLAFPAFLTSAQADPPSPAELLAGLRLTGHFLARHVLEPRGLAPPPARRLLIERLGRTEAPAGLEP